MRAFTSLIHGISWSFLSRRSCDDFDCPKVSFGVAGLLAGFEDAGVIGKASLALKDRVKDKFFASIQCSFTKEASTRKYYSGLAVKHPELFTQGLGSFVGLNAEVGLLLTPHSFAVMWRELQSPGKYKYFTNGEFIDIKSNQGSYLNIALELARIASPSVNQRERNRKGRDSFWEVETGLKPVKFGSLNLQSTLSSPEHAWFWNR